MSIASAAPTSGVARPAISSDATDGFGDGHERRHESGRRDAERDEELLGAGQVAELVEAVQQERHADDHPQHEHPGAAKGRGVQPSCSMIAIHVMPFTRVEALSRLAWRSPYRRRARTPQRRGGSPCCRPTRRARLREEAHDLAAEERRAGCCVERWRSCQEPPPYGVRSRQGDTRVGSLVSLVCGHRVHPVTP